MTTHHAAPATGPDHPHTPGWRPRTEFDLAAQQLRAIERFNDARRAAAAAAVAAARSREMRMDATRSLEVLRREHDALVRRAHEQLRFTGAMLRTRPARRVVLAHRNEWFVSKLSGALQGRGLHVVARVDNGADAIGLAVAEQPDVIMVEDTLAMVPGEQVVREVRTYCPGTFVAAQVAHGDCVGALLHAGAAAVFTRQVPPLETADSLLALLDTG